MQLSIIIPDSYDPISDKISIFLTKFSYFSLFFKLEFLTMWLKVDLSKANNIALVFAIIVAALGAL